MDDVDKVDSAPLGASDVVEAVLAEQVGGPSDWQPTLRMCGQAAQFLADPLPDGGSNWRNVVDVVDLAWRPWESVHSGGGKPFELLLRVGGRLRPWRELPNMARMLCQPATMPDQSAPVCQQPPPATPGERLAARVGRRYADATLDNYEMPTEGHYQAAGAVRAYVGDWRAKAAAGANLVLVGPCGVGKDHLLVGAARVVADAGGLVRWAWGASLYQDVLANRSDQRVADGYATAPILVISDPAGSSHSLHPAQADVLGWVINERDRQLLPTWVSINAASQADAISRLGEPTVDRLRGGATVVQMPLASWRTPVGRVGEGGND